MWGRLPQCLFFQNTLSVLHVEGWWSKQLRFWMETMSKILTTASGRIQKSCGQRWYGIGGANEGAECQCRCMLSWRMQLPSCISSAYTVTFLMVFQGHISERLMQSPDSNFWSQLKDLMVLFRNFTWDTLTFIAIMEATGTVPSAALNQETTWPENGICPL